MDVYILLRWFKLENEDWETYGIYPTFESAKAGALADVREYLDGHTDWVEYCVEHWTMEDSDFVGSTYLELQEE